MFLVGHLALGYITAKGSSRILKTDVDVPLVFALSILPDIDLLIPRLPQDLYVPTVGMVLVGKMTTEEVTVDSKGRVLIPKEVRDKVGLQAGGRARMKIEKENIIIMPPISPEEFVKEMEGCIREGTPAIDPLKLKKMWEPAETQK